MQTTDRISADVIDDIRLRVEGLRGEIVALETEMRNRQVTMESWQRVLDLARAESSQQLPSTGSGRFSEMRAVDATVVLLKEQGRALHITDLLMQLKAGGWVTAAKNQENNLNNIIQRDERFIRVNPRVWDLAERHQGGQEKSDLNGSNIFDKDASGGANETQ